MKHLLRRTCIAILCLTFVTAESWATDLTVSAEATIQGGTSAATDIDEAAAGFIHVKFTGTLDTCRKAYFLFDLTGQEVNTNAPALFTVSFTSSNKQRVQLWALNQTYPAFSSGLTWNSAPANETNSSALLTNGLWTAGKIGVDEIIPLSGTDPKVFSIPRMGDWLFDNKMILVLTAVNDATNNAGGLRIQRAASVLTFSATNSPVTGETNYQVYLAAGQSNMDGRGQNTDLVGPLGSWASPQTNIQIYYVNPVNLNPFQPTYDTGWQTLKPGWSVPPGFSGALPSSTFGPEIAFGRTVADANPGTRVVIIKVAQGGTTLSGDWNPASGYLYVTLTNYARIALHALTNGGASYTLRGMIWHQGESDGSSSTATYQTRLTNFIAAVRRDLGVTNLPFVVGELATNRSLTVRAAQFNVSELIPYVGFASSSNLPTLAADDPHFTAASQIIMGQRMAAALEVPSLRVESFAIVGNNLRLNASGLAGSRFDLLTSTNLTQSISQWSLLTTGRFDAAGRVAVTNFAGANNSWRFYRLAGKL